MVWIRSDSSLAYHTKLDSLIDRLKCSRREAIGSLHLLWWWTADHGRNGILPRVTNAQIAALCDYPGEPERFVLSLVETGFIEKNPEGLKIHDWEDWLSSELYERIKYEKRKESRKIPEFFPKNSREIPGSAQAVSSGSVLLSFPVVKTNGKDNWPLQDVEVKKWSDTFPGVDVISECKKALSWINCNPTRRKTYTGMPRFLNTWLSKAQNYSRPSGVLSFANSKPITASQMDPDVVRVLKGWKFLNEIPTTGPESDVWDSVHYANNEPYARQLIALFGGWEPAVDAMEYVYMSLKSKQLSCTLKTIVSHSDIYREYKAGRAVVR